MIGEKLSSEANEMVPDVKVSVLPFLGLLLQDNNKPKISENPTVMLNNVLFIILLLQSKCYRHGVLNTYG